MVDRRPATPKRARYATFVAPSQEGRYLSCGSPVNPGGGQGRIQTLGARSYFFREEMLFRGPDLDISAAGPF